MQGITTVALQESPIVSQALRSQASGPSELEFIAQVGDLFDVPISQTHARTSLQSSVSDSPEISEHIPVCNCLR